MLTARLVGAADIVVVLALVVVGVAVVSPPFPSPSCLRSCSRPSFARTSRRIWRALEWLIPPRPRPTRSVAAPGARPSKRGALQCRLRRLAARSCSGWCRCTRRPSASETPKGTAEGRESGSCCGPCWLHTPAAFHAGRAYKASTTGTLCWNRSIPSARTGPETWKRRPGRAVCLRTRRGPSRNFVYVPCRPMCRPCASLPVGL